MICIGIFSWVLCVKQLRCSRLRSIQLVCMTSRCKDGNIIHLLSGFEGNRWSVGPEDELLPEAEGNSSSEGPTDHLLPENPDNNCFVIPHFLELFSMMNGQAPDKMIHYTTQKLKFFSFLFFFFFLPLMSHFSRQNTNAIAYKNHWFFSSSSNTAGTVSKNFSKRCIFSSRPRTFFFRFSNDCSIALRHSFSIFYAVLTTFFCVLTVPAVKNYIYFQKR